MPSDLQLTERFARHVNPSLVKLLGVLGYGRVFVRAQGTSIWDREGRQYLDCLAAFGATPLGHAHPRLKRAIAAHLEAEVPELLHTGPSAAMADLAEALARAAGEPFEVTLFATTGAEAVEAGLKLARAATGRERFVHCSGGFHGTSLGTLSVLGAPRMRAPFEPLLAGCEAIAFGDLAALERALADRKCAAFLVEPIQAEGGVQLPPAGYLAQAQALCKKHGSLLVLDEVQTGLGRTGSLFAFQREGFVPDVVCLGKALGGGIVPVSAACTSRHIHERAYAGMDKFDLHGSTYAGYALGCAVAQEALRALDEEQLIENAKARGEQLIGGLRDRLRGHPFVREVRGRGLMVGLELGPRENGGLFSKLAAPVVRALSRNVFGQWLALRLLERGIICQPCAHRWDVLKLVPPLTIGEAEVARVVAEVGDVLDGYRDLAPLLADVTARLGRQVVNGGKFS